MGEKHQQVRCLPCLEKTDSGFKQTFEWIAFSDEEPPETETVLLATDYSLALGHIDLQREFIIEYMPWGQEEGEEDDPEFLYWMPLPQTPIWLKVWHKQELKRSTTVQLNLWE